MKLEPGKYYRTRDGRKARIYAVDGGGEYPVHGALLSRCWVWGMHTWRSDGTAAPDTDFPADICVHWTDPKPRRLAWICTETMPNERYKKGDVLMVGTGELFGTRFLFERAPWLDEPESP